ncbi:adenylosuccinate synthetase [Metarhizium acridum CQMa 102]|uniref:Adenylosuccinate synthetase n=1 Tax=Metarhizium acridum (strain CQMa 102) TaxID=655827 RepID=E9DVC4_METAQ|nr:adenylosuccinate synthetase [Metarhizium acridum CQMa 102]EFY92301.1 adenylosuccinate synthetase [Metarhizium acridum CQMa 102]
MNFIGSGVVFHVPSFFSELRELEEKGLTAVHDRILVSDRVNVLLDLHMAVDGLEERELGDAAIGTTRRGIGPCYQTSRARTGIKLTDVFYPDLFKQKEYHRDNWSGQGLYYPCRGGGLQDRRYGEIGTKVQEIGREWGTSTGRRRRCGWLDLVVVNYSNSINYYTSLNLTKLDVLDTFETIKIAIAYKIDGEELDSYPADLDILNRAEVVYHEMPGWQRPTTNARTYYDLPKAARDYVEYIEKFVGVKIKYIGTGPDREAMIQRP